MKIKHTLFTWIPRTLLGAITAALLFNVSVAYSDVNLRSMSKADQDLYMDGFNKGRKFGLIFATCTNSLIGDRLDHDLDRNIPSYRTKQISDMSLRLLLSDKLMTPEWLMENCSV